MLKNNINRFAVGNTSVITNLIGFAFLTESDIDMLEYILTKTKEKVSDIGESILLLEINFQSTIDLKNRGKEKNNEEQVGASPFLIYCSEGLSEENAYEKVKLL